MRISTFITVLICGILALLALDANAVEIPNFIDRVDPRNLAETVGGKIFALIAFVVVISAAIAGLIATYHIVWGESEQGWKMVKNVGIGLVLVVSIGGLIAMVVP